MSIPRQLNILLVLFIVSACNKPVRQGPNLGIPASPDQIKTWNIGVFPDGKNLPTGQGTAVEGESLFNRYCQSCHGPEGRGATAEELAGGENGLRHEYPDKTIGTYWPYATTVFDFIRRAMPLYAPGSLSDNEVYAITAYLLYLNGIVTNTTVINANTLPELRMPNQKGFINMYPNSY